MEHANPLLGPSPRARAFESPSPALKYQPYFFPCFSLCFIIFNCVFRVFSILYFFSLFVFVFLYFSFFSLPQQRVRLFHVNHRRGGEVVLSRFWHSLTWNRSTIWAPKQCPFFPDLGLYIFWKCFKPVILVVALCWQQKCFKWAILNKDFNRKNIFHHLQIQDWAVGPQDPHRWLTWNMRTRCWVQVLETGLCSPPSPTPSHRPQLWNINLIAFFHDPCLKKLFQGIN